jgi:membrane protease YdiL (CAAX protease family)
MRPENIVVERQPSPLWLSVGPQAKWNTLDATWAIIGAFVIYILLGGSVVFGIARALHEKHPGVWIAPASYAFLSLGTFWMVYWLIIVRRGATWRDIGYRPVHLGHLLNTVVLAFGAVWIGAAIIAELVNRFTGFHIESNARELLPYGQSHLSSEEYIVLLFLAGIMAPLTEETLFRGVLYQALCRDLSRVASPLWTVLLAALTSGTIFGVIHLLGGPPDLHAFPILAYFGIILGLAFQRGGSIYASALVHAINNTIAVTVLFLHH